MRRAGLILLVMAAAFAAAAPAAGKSGLGMTLSPDARFPDREFVVTLPDGANPGDVRVTENGLSVVAHMHKLSGDRLPLSLAVVLDTSDSMRGKPLNAALAAASTLLDAKPLRSEAAVFGFAKEPYVIHTWSTNSSDFSAALSGVTTTRETALWDAVVNASQQLGTRSGSARTIVLLTDGRDTISVADSQSAIRAANASHVRIYAVGLAGASLDRTDLQAVVDATGGEFIEVQSAKQLSAVYKGIAKRLNAQYSMTYTSQIRKPGTQVVVELRIGNQTVEQRYSVPVTGGSPAPSTNHGFWQSNLALALLAIAVGLIILGGSFLVLRPRRMSAAQRLRRYGISGGANPLADVLADMPPQPTRRSARPTSRRIWSRFVADVDRGELDQSPAKILLASTAASVGAALLVALLTKRPVTMLVVAPLGPLIAWFYVTRRASSWYAHFDESLADSLTVLASSLRAGHSLLQAIAHVADEADDRIAREWNETVRRTRLGISVDDALDEMVERVGNRDLQWIALVARVQHQAGGNMAEMFDIVAETVRARHRLRAQIHSLTAQGRMSRWILTLMPLALTAMFFVLSPKYLAELYGSTTGLAMIAVAVTGVVVGSLWLKQIVEIEV